MFWLKKLIGHLISPAYCGFGLLLIGLYLRWRSKHRTLSHIFIGLGILIPTLAFNNGLADRLNRTLEHAHPAIPSTRGPNTSPLAYLAVLGGGQVENPELAHITQLVNSSRARLVEGVRLANMFPNAKLLMCGPQGRAHSKPHAAFLAESAQELGVHSSRIRQLSSGRDTQGEIQEIASIVKSNPVGIVTSAWHMPRAMAMARQAGLNAVACPSDYRTGSPKPHISYWFTFSPSAYESTERALREYIGILWAKIRGQA